MPFARLILITYVFKILSSTKLMLQIILQRDCLQGSKLIACLLILEHLSNFAVNFFKKISTKSKYLSKTVNFLANKISIWAFCARGIAILAFKQAIYMTKASLPRSRAADANSLCLMSYTCLIVDSVLITLYILQISSFFINFIFTLLKDKKSIPRIISILSTIKKVFQKKPALLSLFSTRKFAQTILNV